MRRNLTYAGIGSRKTPQDIMEQMTAWARYLDGRGWLLRSGGAAGADTAFAVGSTHKVIFDVPFFERSPQDIQQQAMRLAAFRHPAWGACGDYAKKLHARNGFQILGVNLRSPVDLVICWTPDGAQGKRDTSVVTGGAGQAIRIAALYDIPVINLKRDGWYDRLLRLVEEIETNAQI